MMMMLLLLVGSNNSNDVFSLFARQASAFVISHPSYMRRTRQLTSSCRALDGSINGYDDDNMKDEENEEEGESFDTILEEMSRIVLEQRGGTISDDKIPPANPFAFAASSRSTNPFAAGLSRINKADLYDVDELSKVFNVHTDIRNEEDEPQQEDDDDDDDDDEFMLGLPPFPSQKKKSFLEQQNGGLDSLHKLVLQAIDAPQSSVVKNDDDIILKKVSNIRGIASDVDGTILSKGQSLHPRTRKAIKDAIAMAVASSADSNRNTNGNVKLCYFFPATGKSRKGALDSLGRGPGGIGALIEESNCPGVYLQGLYCVDGDGTVIFEQKLTQHAISVAEGVVEEYGVSVVGYDGDDLYTTEQTESVIELHEFYGEPLPILLRSTEDANSVLKLQDHTPGMHKLLLMHDDTELLSNVVRPQLEALAEECGATVTQAIPTMLEWLPAGCSKAMGVTKLCDALGIVVSDELLALGDAENDAEMLQIAAIGVAMANACPIAKTSSDIVMNETNCQGGAGAAMELYSYLRTMSSENDFS
eukprot:CAMPEP_0198297914 /NCGR_PEP_ID=MMETSP1449-20131203/38848_1 /TAXON_ID=420275 /ORGANISM="Attheya septentrionalis, Strain CCMP2084" /LENGTH=531 /DNA_ID=CAMNT_0043999019 /DNA_START=181 /DNA_END=1776 /DNA_ORIENTATION=-